jgi:hypothetical protein
MPGTGFDIDFAFRFDGAGSADVLQNGTYIGGDTAYGKGARRVAGDTPQGREQAGGGTSPDS